jgi:hypothetical protein
MIVAKRPSAGVGTAFGLALLWFCTMSTLAWFSIPGVKSLKAEEKIAASTSPEPPPPQPSPLSPAPPLDPGPEWAIPQCPESVCADSELTPDREALTATYSRLEATLTPEQKSELTKSHEEWLKSLEACTVSDCVSSLYQARAAELRKLDASSS